MLTCCFLCTLSQSQKSESWSSYSYCAICGLIHLTSLLLLEDTPLTFSCGYVLIMEPPSEARWSVLKEAVSLGKWKILSHMGILSQIEEEHLEDSNLLGCCWSNAGPSSPLLLRYESP